MSDRRWAGVAVLFLAASGFGLRLGFWEGRVYHVDEFISMLAAVMTARKGAPVLPSGLFYDHGLTLSYLSAPLIALLGFDELVARWPSVLVGTFAIAASYAVARRLFRSPAAGFAAALVVALDGLSIEWSGRARMYSLAWLFVLLMLASLGGAVPGRAEKRPRHVYTCMYMAALFYVLAFFSHSVSVMLLLPLALCVLAVALFSRRARPVWHADRKRLALYALTLVVVVALTMGVAAMGQVGSTTAFSEETEEEAGLFSDFLDPGVSWSRVDDFVYFFTRSDYYRVLLPLVALSASWGGYNVARRKGTPRDPAALLLALSMVLVMVEMGFLLSHSWRKSRYMFTLCLPQYVLLAGDGVARVADAARWLAGARGRHAGKAVSVLAAAVLLWLWLPHGLELAVVRGAGGYDTAFGRVRGELREGDKIMTVHPSASYLYTGRCDYYASERWGRVLEVESGTVDRYTGSPLVGSGAELNALLDGVSGEGGRLWFVVDEPRLFSRYDPFFVQTVFARMDAVGRDGIVSVFTSKPASGTLSEQPPRPAGADFGGVILLGGYGVSPQEARAGDSLWVELFWRPLGDLPEKEHKVFIHLRDARNNPVAQADHFLLEGYLKSGWWDGLRQEGEWLRDGSVVDLPPALPPGEYRLLVGIYDPETMERVPLVDDRNGENAALLGAVRVVE